MKNALLISNDSIQHLRSVLPKICEILNPVVHVYRKRKICSICVICGLLKLLINWSEVGTGPVVGSFLVHAEGIPGGGAEDVFVLDVMHTDWDAEDRAERQHIGTDVSVGNGAVVGSPAVHDTINVLEAVF